MKSYIEEPDSASIGHSERLNRPVKVLVIDRVLIMLTEAFSGTGRSVVFCGISPIEPDSAARKRSLKTRIVKNEFGFTTKRNVSNF